MVLPLLPLIGLAAAGGVTLAAPHLQNRAARIRGRYGEGLLDEAGDDPRDQARALFGGGLLEARDLIGAQSDAAQRDLGWFNADTSRMSAETARMGLGENIAQARIGSVPSPGGIVQGDLAWGVLTNMESGDNWQAVSPKGASGLGQIMPENIGPWTRELIDPNLSDAQAIELYRNDPSVQERVGRGKFGQYVNRYGLRDAYSRWHSGVGFEQAVREGRHDGNMSTYDYVRSNLQAYERRTAEAAAQDERDFRGWAVETGGTEWERQALANPYLPRSMAEEITGNVVGRMSGDGVGAQLEQQAAIATAGDELMPAIGSAEAVIANMDAIARTEAGERVSSADDQARSAAGLRAAMELRQAWQAEVYGDREPPPEVQREMASVFGSPRGLGANQEQFMRLTRMMRAELVKKRDYLRAQAEVRAGRRPVSELAAFNGGVLTPEERRAILTGQGEAPPGLERGW